jgi:hypothetical protein
MKRVFLTGLIIVALGAGSLFAAPSGANANPAASTGQNGSSGGLKPANSAPSKTAKKSKKKHHKKKHHKTSKKS